MSKPKNPNCPFCGAGKVYKVGKYPIVSEERKKQRFKCWECGKTFYAPKAIEK